MIDLADLSRNGARRPRRRGLAACTLAATLLGPSPSNGDTAQDPVPPLLVSGDQVRVVRPATAYLEDGTARVSDGFDLLVVRAGWRLVGVSLPVDGVRELAWLRRGSVRRIVSADRPAAASLDDLEHIGVRVVRAPGGAVVAIDASDTPIRDIDLALLSSGPVDVKPLVDLRLSGTAITDRGLRHVAELTSLEALYLAYAAITPQATAALASLQKLEVLSLQGTNLSNASLVAVARLPALRTLNLSRTAISDSGLAALRDARSLEVVALAHTQSSVAGLAHLANAPRLHTLNIDATRVGDADIAKLLALPSLRLLYARDLGISDARVRELRRARRSLSVETR